MNNVRCYETGSCLLQPGSLCASCEVHCILQGHIVLCRLRDSLDGTFEILFDILVLDVDDRKAKLL